MSPTVDKNGIGVRQVMVASDSNNSKSTNSQAFGYITFVEIPNHGFVGGFLIVNTRARPLEFHCTAPVVPNRAQEILYGRTFRSALLCDQIGQALLKQSMRKPCILLTDEADALDLRKMNGIPVALFVDEQAATQESNDNDSSITSRSQWTFEMAGCSLTTSNAFEDDRSKVREALRQIEPGWELMEPLERIRAAIREARQAAA